MDPYLKEKKRKSSKKSKPITRKEIDIAVKKYLKKGGVITKIEILPEDPIWVKDYHDTDSFLRGNNV